MNADAIAMLIAGRGGVARASAGGPPPDLPPIFAGRTLDDRPRATKRIGWEKTPSLRRRCFLRHFAGRGATPRPSQAWAKRRPLTRDVTNDEIQVLLRR